jgi:arylsulfatase A-like enzyme
VEILLILLFWSICAANAGNILFFGSPLSLKVVQTAHAVAWDIRETVLGFFRHPLFLGSSILLVLSPFSKFWMRPRLFVDPRARIRSGLTLAVLFLFQQVPVWSRTEVPGSILSDQPVLTWSIDLSKAARQISGQRDVQNQAIRGEHWREDLIEFRRRDWLPKTDSRSDPESTTEELRKAFGLDPHRAPNILFVVSESARALEFLKAPLTNHTLYPELHARLARKGITFEKTLTSASWTIHGLYQLLCGRFDAFDGASVYRSSPYLQEKCLPALLGDAGYRTYSLRAYHRYFDGAFVFESSHGIQNFLDRTTFSPRTPAESIDANEWGMADEFFFPRVFEKLQELSSDERPFYAYILPVGGHAPWKPAQKFALPHELQKLFPGDDPYIGFLTRFRAFDSALSNFIDRIDQEPRLKNTVIFVIGDHGTRILPQNHTLNPVQTEFLLSRVLGAVTSPGMTTSVLSKLPVHQVDFPPLAARLAGIKETPNDWMGTLPVTTHGKEITPVTGTPWMDQGPWGVRYQLADRVCLSEPPGSQFAREHRLRCHSLKESDDPLLNPAFPEIEEDPGITRKVERFIQASDARIINGGLEARKRFIRPSSSSASPEAGDDK